MCVHLRREWGYRVKAAGSSLSTSKVNLPAVEDWQAEEQMTTEEHRDRTEETVSLTQETLTCQTHLEPA